MSDTNISSNLLALIKQKMRGDNISLEAFNRVVEEELARISTKAVHESRGSAFSRFLNKHSGAFVSFALGTVIATLLTVALENISESKQEQRKFEEGFEQRVSTYERLLAERIERGNLLRVAIRYEMPATDLAYRKEKYDESYLQVILSFTQFRRFATQSLAKSETVPHLIVQAGTADESDAFSALIEGYLMPLMAAVDGCVSYAYRMKSASRDGTHNALIGDLLDYCPYGVSRPVDWIEWTEDERATYQRGRTVEYYSATAMNLRSRECVSKIFDSVKDVVFHGQEWDFDKKKKLVGFCSMKNPQVLSCNSEFEKSAVECRDSKGGISVVKNDLRRDVFLADGSLLGRLFPKQGQK